MFSSAIRWAWTLGATAAAGFVGSFIAQAFGAIYLSLVIAAVGAAAIVSMVIAGAFV